MLECKLPGENKVKITPSVYQAEELIKYERILKHISSLQQKKCFSVFEYEKIIEKQFANVLIHKWNKYPWIFKLSLTSTISAIIIRT